MYMYSVYSKLSPCGHSVITDTRYYGQNSAPPPTPVKASHIHVEDWLKMTPAIADSRYYGLQTVCPEPGVRYNES